MIKKIASLLLTVSFAGLTWAQQIDLNKATEIELDGLHGVGPVLTKELMTERNKAPFKDWADVTTRVKGIGLQKAGSLSDQGVRVQGIGFAEKTSDKKSTKPAGALATKASPANN